MLELHISSSTSCRRSLRSRPSLGGSCFLDDWQSGLLHHLAKVTAVVAREFESLIIRSSG